MGERETTQEVVWCARSQRGPPPNCEIGKTTEVEEEPRQDLFHLGSSRIERILQLDSPNNITFPSEQHSQQMPPRAPNSLKNSVFQNANLANKDKLLRTTVPDKSSFPFSPYFLCRFFHRNLYNLELARQQPRWPALYSASVGHVNIVSQVNSGMRPVHQGDHSPSQCVPRLTPAFV